MNHRPNSGLSDRRPVLDISPALFTWVDGATPELRVGKWEYSQQKKKVYCITFPIIANPDIAVQFLKDSGAAVLEI